MRMVIDSNAVGASIERILVYCNLKQEKLDGLTGFYIPKGRIDFKDVWLRYKEDAEYALKGLEFTVEPGVKLGIVGRTGAGKSSIMQALFRLTEINSGSILIDKQDITKYRVRDVRSQISVIFQTPILF
jgi:ATP-binding cassette subfamily C (CFTR/MRP) protein 10